MKHLYLLGTVFALSLAHAQTGNFYKNPKLVSNLPYETTAKADVIFQQFPIYSDNIISTADQGNNLVIAADDFQLSERTKIDKFIFFVEQYDGNLTNLFLGSRLYIFEDNNGFPSATPSNAGNAVAVINIVNNPAASSISTTGSPTVFEITVNISTALGSDLFLEADKRYWVAFAPRVNFSTPIGTDLDEVSYWINGNGQYAVPVVIDEANLSGSGFTNWTTIESIWGEPFEGLAFRITGETALGTKDVYSNLKKVSVYPNPATNVINLKPNSKLTITKTQIFDMNGKLVLSTADSSINIEKLPKAVYLVKIFSGNELIETTKMIKE